VDQTKWKKIRRTTSNKIKNSFRSRYLFLIKLENSELIYSTTQHEANTYNLESLISKGEKVTIHYLPEDNSKSFHNVVQLEINEQIIMKYSSEVHQKNLNYLIYFLMFFELILIIGIGMTWQDAKYEKRLKLKTMSQTNTD
jgi:hypothetical protein